MKFKIEVSEGSRVPIPYGIAYHIYRSMNNRIAVCYPIGINVLVRLIRALYYIIWNGIFKERFIDDLMAKWDDRYRKALEEIETLNDQIATLGEATAKHIDEIARLEAALNAKDIINETMHNLHAADKVIIVGKNKVIKQLQNELDYERKMKRRMRI